jgi:hypothetical protein
MVLDTRGVPVWYYRSSVPMVGVADVDSLVPGEISFKPSDEGPSTPFEIHTLSPPSTFDISAPSLDAHELQRLPNGDYLVITAALVEHVDLEGLVLPLPDGGTLSFGADSTIVNCGIAEVEPKTGAVVWTWDAQDHFDPVKDLTYLSTGILLKGTRVVQPYHCNSIAVDANGNLLVSGRHMDSIFYIERPSGRVLWKMGGATFSKDDAVYVPLDAGPFYRQHDARLQASWSYTCAGGRGQVSVFDDETEAPGPMRAVTFDVTIPLPPPGDGGAVDDCGVAAGDGGRGTATLAWEYLGVGTSTGNGSFRVLADGSRTIGWGFVPLTFSEVDEAGVDLLDFRLTTGDSSYRAIKVPLTDLDLDVLRSTAGGPVDAGAD